MLADFKFNSFTLTLGLPCYAIAGDVNFLQNRIMVHCLLCNVLTFAENALSHSLSYAAKTSNSVHQYSLLFVPNVSITLNYKSVL